MENEIQAPAAPAPAATPAIPASPPAAPSPPPAATITAPPPAPPAVQTVTIPLEQLQAFTTIQARLADMEASQRAQQAAADRERQDLLLAKGQAEEAVRLMREQSEAALKAERDQRTQEQERTKRYALDNEITGVLANHDFINDRARQSFAAEIRHEFVVEAQGTGFAVRTPTFQDVKSFVAGKLALPDYEYMLRPKGNPGGGTQTPSQQTQQAPAAPATTPAAPTFPNLGHAIIAQYKDNVASRGQTGDPKFNPAMPYGLKAAQ